MDRRQLNEEQREIEEYEEWLMENEPERVTCKDALISLSESGYRFDEFIKQRTA